MEHLRVVTEQTALMELILLFGLLHLLAVAMVDADKLLVEVAGLVAVVAQLLVRVEAETLQALHHHKEIMVVLRLILLTNQVRVVVVVRAQ